MKILITGGTGFLGSYLIRELLRNKHEIVLLKRSISVLKRVADCLNGITTYNIDEVAVSHVFKENPDVTCIMHMATNYGRHGETTGQMLMTNVDFPLALLEGIVAYSPHCQFINIDSILDRRINRYALTKKQFVEWGKFYTEHYDGFTFINVLLEHIYGPFDDKEKFISHVIAACVNNETNLPLTKGEQKRDFIYVDDVVAAIMCILGQPHSAGYHEYEVGSGKSVAIKTVVEYVREITQSTTRLEWGALPYRKYEIMKSVPHIEKICNLGWEPKVMLPEGIKQILVREYHENIN